MTTPQDFFLGKWGLATRTTVAFCHPECLAYFLKHPDEFKVDDNVVWQDLFIASAKHSSREAAQALGQFGLAHVYCAPGEALSDFGVHAQAHALAELVRDRQPAAVLLPATNDGRDVAVGARAAVRRRAGTATCFQVLVGRTSLADPID